MQLSPENRTKFENQFNQLKDDTRKLLRGSAVMLNGAPFTASGVIFAYDKLGNTLIITAKHNLVQGATYKPGKKPAPSKLVDAFTSKMKIMYGFVDFEKKGSQTALFNQGPNNGGNTKIFGGADQDNWDYDVMILTSPDQALLAHAKQYAVVKTATDLKDLVEKLAIPKLALARSDSHLFIQVGFGNSTPVSSDSDKYVGRFQVRYTSPEASAFAKEVYDYDEEARVDFVNTNVVMMTANNDNSSAPGDSGGPLFLLDITEKASPKVFLLSVALGANQSLTPKTPVSNLPILVGTSNYVKPLLCMLYPTTEGC